jgi:hypothetical protein
MLGANLENRLVTRRRAVQDQLDTAIRAYFLWDDLVSAITLAGAAERVLSDMQPQDGIIGIDAYSIRSAVNLYFKTEHQSEAAGLFRKDYDFFRHADRQNVDSHEIKDISVVFTITIAIASCEFLSIEKTEIMKIFFWWTYIKYPKFFKKDCIDIFLDIDDIRRISEWVSKREYFLILCRKLNIEIF